MAAYEAPDKTSPERIADRRYLSLHIAKRLFIVYYFQHYIAFIEAKQLNNGMGLGLPIRLQSHLRFIVMKYDHVT